MNTRSLIMVIGGFLALAAIPHFVRAEDFVSIVPLPFQVSDSTTIDQYLNGVFKITLSLSAGLAVIMLVIGGFEYMTSEALGGKSKGRERIQGAVIGLVLLAASYLILYVINPCLITLQLTTSGTTPCTTPGSSSSGSSFQPPAGTQSAPSTGIGSQIQWAVGSQSQTPNTGTTDSKPQQFPTLAFGKIPFQVLSSNNFPGYLAACFADSACPDTYTSGGTTYKNVGALSPDAVAGCTSNGPQVSACAYRNTTLAPNADTIPDCAQSYCPAGQSFYFDAVGGRCCSSTFSGCYLQQKFAADNGATVITACVDKTQ